MRYKIILLLMLFWSVPAAHAQVSIGIRFPGVSIGINTPVYPEFVRVPGYPVYYAPRLDANFFFYDGMYWVFQGDNWYASSWYNGPWGMVAPVYVPLYVLRVPVFYYRQPPAYFRGWRRNEPPRWGRHWGREWERQRSGWNRWNRRSAPKPAPLPDYQRQYSGDRYPQQVEQQYKLHQQSYRYQPRESIVRQHYEEQAVQRAPVRQERRKAPDYEEQAVQRAPVRQERRKAPDQRGFRQQDSQRSNSPPTGGQQDRKRSAPTNTSSQQRRRAAQDQGQQQEARRDQRTPDSSRDNNPEGKGKAASSKQKRNKSKKQDGDQDQE